MTVLMTHGIAFSCEIVEQTPLFYACRTIFVSITTKTTTESDQAVQDPTVTTTTFRLIPALTSFVTDLITIVTRILMIIQLTQISNVLLNFPEYVLAEEQPVLMADNYNVFLIKFQDQKSVMASIIVVMVI